MKYFTVPVNKSVLGEISVVVFLEFNREIYYKRFYPY